MDTRYVPGKSKLQLIARKFRNELFHDPKWRLDYKSMIELFNIISKDPSAPNPYGISYGLAIDGINNATELLHDLGTGGSNLQLQSKQAVTCSLLKLDAHNNVRNRKLFKKVLPHRNKDCRNKWIKQCVSYLLDYKSKKSTVFVKKYDDMTRNS